MLTFQSRFGIEEWLTPYTDETVKKASPCAALRRLAVVTPDLVADSLETLEGNSGSRMRTSSAANGGTDFAAIPCLNDSAPGMRVLGPRRTARASGLGCDGRLKSI